jgi:hypothetical protein
MGRWKPYFSPKFFSKNLTALSFVFFNPLCIFNRSFTRDQSFLNLKFSRAKATNLNLVVLTQRRATNLKFSRANATTGKI